MSAPPVVACQRWRDRRDSYRPLGETITTHAHEVAVIESDGPAKAFVVQHHYSASYPAARFRVGLYRRGELAGVAVFSQPSSQAVLDDLPDGRASGTVLGRFVLLDRVEANGETWFLSRARELLAREGYSGFLSDSDPASRDTAAGHVVFGGHIGTIYQASSALYLGRTERRTRRLLPDGTVFDARAWAKLRSKDRGWRYAAELLERHGAPSPGADPSPATLRAWAATWVPRLTRARRHPGNHRYLFPLDRATRRLCGPWLPYPKRGTSRVERIA